MKSASSRKNAVKKKGLPSLKTLRKKAVEVFNAFIRRRDTNGAGLGRCISCSQYRKLEAGHWLRSVHTATRFREENVNGQCSYCNRFHDSEYEYGLAMLRKYGKPIVDELISLKHKEVRLRRQDLLDLIAKYS